MRRTLRALVGLGLSALAVTSVGDARAQTAPTAAPQLADPSALPIFMTNFAWDQDLLRASFSFRNISTQPVRNKLSSGLPNTIVVRAYVFEEGVTDPIALATRACTVTYDLWEEVYRVKIEESSSGPREQAVVNVGGVERLCMQAQDLPIVARRYLKKGKQHYLSVIAEVNPISPQTLQQIKQWVSRPTGSTQLTAGDALFGSFVTLFVRQIGQADATVTFRSQTFVP
jgi:hypothetical protein